MSTTSTERAVGARIRYTLAAFRADEGRLEAPREGLPGVLHSGTSDVDATRVGICVDQSHVIPEALETHGVNYESCRVCCSHIDPFMW